ncbi:MAG: DUF924 family protein [Myxococcota bacterium]
MRPDDVLDWWFGDWKDSAPLRDGDPNLLRWWHRDAAVDAEARERFGVVHAELARGEHEDWEQTARGALAKVIVLDQLSRMLYRGSARAFRWDEQARGVTQRALEQARDRELRPIERVFLYLPLMHAEDRVPHRRALALYSDLAEEVEEAGLARADIYRRFVAWEVRHKKVIDRFGRYPHRNLPLERTSTPEELAFIDAESSRTDPGV